MLHFLFLLYKRNDICVLLHQIRLIPSLTFSYFHYSAYALITMSMASFFLETACTNMAIDCSNKWFAALLRQDMAYHDVQQDVTGSASLISSRTNIYARGLGRKLGEGLLFTTALLGGLVYAFWSSWQISLVVVAVIPIMVASGAFFSSINKAQNTFVQKNYATAGSIVYTTVLCIRTVLALNAVENMIAQYTKANEKAYLAAKNRGCMMGCGSGLMMGSFQVSYLALTILGAYFVYTAIRQDGCDPSVSQFDTTGSGCNPSGTDIFGAFMGMSMAGQGIPIVLDSLQLLTK